MSLQLMLLDNPFLSRYQDQATAGMRIEYRLSTKTNSGVSTDSHSLLGAYWNHQGPLLCMSSRQGWASGRALSGLRNCSQWGIGPWGCYISPCPAP